ncbi:helix-turn-helix and ligand-binding sensor domain-containing protein [Aegicerativicinus sediminis]|uniref:helix-turn-helix and ligand-binding sensor domain-containing protein n=1 Tax=Aegicerativicinus sediminis TaxID=2893202 RepID=UPI001E5BD57D|nr:LuxR C-terminal-related transcriptional regulator [Aegicerativicinus sediminis]
MIKRVLYILCLLLIHISVYGQFTPYFKNYELSDYNGANQNWDVCIAEDGMVYVANHRGLLTYDGLVWKLHELPNKTIIRSVFSIGPRIYTGSFEEFGFWEKDEYGDLKYTSLKDRFEQNIPNNEEFWQILSFGDKIVFKSYSNLYIYNGDSIKRFVPSSSVMYITIIDNEILVATLNAGIYKFDGLGFSRYFNHPSLVDTRVMGITESKDGVIISTALKGSFKISGKNLIALNRPIDKLIKEHQLNRLTQLNDGRQVYGTIKNGCFITDQDGTVISHLSKSEGLVNNTVLGLSTNDENLWLALDNGLAKVSLDENYQFYNDISGKLGAVYDVIFYNGTYYIGSNTGLFYLNKNRELEFVEGTNGQIWDLRIIDGQLFCGHNVGTFIVENEAIEWISSYTGGWTLKKIPEKPDSYIQGTYAGVVRFSNLENSNWNVKHLGRTYMPIKYLEFENQHTLWAANAYKGLYKFNISDNLDTITNIESYDNKGLYSQYNVRIYKIKGEVCFKTNEGWQQYGALQDSIIPFPLLDKKIGKDAYIISEFDEDELVIKSEDKSIKFISFENSSSPVTISSTFFENRLIDGDEKVVKIKDSIYALNLNNGFVLIDRSKPIAIGDVSKPILNTISINYEPVKLDDWSDNFLNIDYGNDVVITASASKNDNYSLEYSITDGTDKWVIVPSNTIELKNLKSGKYNLILRTRNEFGEASDSSVIKINVSPPWYNDTPGYVLFFSLMVVMILIFYWMHKRKIAKEQSLLQAKMMKEQEELLREKAIENEKQIVLVKNQSLKNELKLKTKQLANSAMALAKKNETLIGLKKDLVQSKEQFNNYYSFKNIIKKVDHSITHRDEWELFEENFNQVHEEFFTNLKEKHPNLNPKDLRMCAYIKMGLSTKKIAPLLNISVRGVETHRYRLKKKLNLDNGKKIGGYLRSL